MNKCLTHMTTRDSAGICHRCKYDTELTVDDYKKHVSGASDRTDWHRMKALLDEFGIKYEIEQGEIECFRVHVYQNEISIWDFHQGGRYERGLQ